MIKAVQMHRDAALQKILPPSVMALDDAGRESACRDMRMAREALRQHMHEVGLDPESQPQL